MKNYNRVMAGRKSMHAELCFNEGFIGVDFDIDVDLTGRLPENWREFNKEFIPIFLANNPDKSKVAAGLACGMTWTVSKYLNKGDIVITPDGRDAIVPEKLPARTFMRRVSHSSIGGR